MCLIALGWRAHPRYRLVLVANRDEFLARPTAAATFWEDCPAILAGRDLQQRGTWMGVTMAGRFAALTNYRDPASENPHARSRGDLVRAFLCGCESPRAFAERTVRAGGDYNGFNLLVGDRATLMYCSNRSLEVREVTDGYHGLSNHLLDTAWPKVRKSVGRLAALVGGEEVILPGRLLDMMSDREPAPDDELPDTGVGLQWERALSPLHVAAPGYGTRATTVLVVDHSERVQFVERTFPSGSEAAFDFVAT